MTVVTFSLTLETDLSSYDAEETKASLATLYDVPAESISLSIMAASLQLNVTIFPVDASPSGAAALSNTINSKGEDEVSQALSTVASITAAHVEVVVEEYESTCPTGCVLVACVRACVARNH